MASGGTGGVGVGTIQSNASSSTITASPNSGTLARDLVVLVAHVSGAVDATNARDAGDGWIFLETFYVSGDAYGLILACCLTSRNGSSGYAGITLPSAAKWTSNTYSYRANGINYFDLSRISGSKTAYSDPTANTTLNAPAINQPYHQVLDLVARGWEKASPNTTAANITGYTERFDSSNATQGQGVVLNDRTAEVTGAVQNASLTGSTASAGAFNHVGLRGMVGIVSQPCTRAGRYGAARRVF